MTSYTNNKGIDLKNSDVLWKNANVKSLVGYHRWSALMSMVSKTRPLDTQKPILFIHIPKTAGRSLIDTYSDYFADAHHSPALMYKTSHNIDNMTLVSVVRNPWERLYSSYEFLISGGLTEADRRVGELLKKQTSDFNFFVKHWLVKYTTYSYMHFVPQTDFLFDWRNKLIPCDIIRFENLARGWDDFAAKQNLPRQELPKKNVSTKVSYKDVYDAESIEIVRKLYAKDIDFLGYKF